MNPEISKRCAEAQGAVIAGKAGPSSLLPFEPFIEAQRLVTATNLVFRQDILLERLDDAYEQFEELHRDGYWAENYGYMMYSKSAFDHVYNGGGLDIMHSTFAMMLDNYAALAFPDGSLPLPEASADVRLPFDPLTMADDVDTPSYRVKRWFTPDRSECLAQLLVCKDTNPEPRANLHYALAAGYFVLWVKGIGYVNRVKPYTGFDLLRNTESADLAACLPRGALRSIWRLNPPIIGGGLLSDQIGFVWAYKDGEVTMVTAERRITWNNAFVKVCDNNGGDRIWNIPD